MDVNEIKAALKPLADIADAWERNELDDEARRFWGRNDQHTTSKHPWEIQLYSGRGGKELLTLAHCFDARAVYRSL